MLIRHSFANHTTRLKLTNSSVINIAFSVFKNRDANFYLKLVHTYVISHIDYCCPIYSHVSGDNVNKIVQRFYFYYINFSDIL